MSVFRSLTPRVSGVFWAVSTSRARSSPSNSQQVESCAVDVPSGRGAPGRSVVDPPGAQTRIGDRDPVRGVGAPWVDWPAQPLPTGRPYGSRRSPGSPAPACPGSADGSSTRAVRSGEVPAGRGADDAGRGHRRTDRQQVPATQTRAMTHRTPGLRDHGRWGRTTGRTRATLLRGQGKRDTTRRGEWLWSSSGDGGPRDREPAPSGRCRSHFLETIARLARKSTGGMSDPGVVEQWRRDRCGGATLAM